MYLVVLFISFLWVINSFLFSPVSMSIVFNSMQMCYCFVSGIRSFSLFYLYSSGKKANKTTLHSKWMKDFSYFTARFIASHTNSMKMLIGCARFFMRLVPKNEPRKRFVQIQWMEIFCNKTHLHKHDSSISSHRKLSVSPKAKIRYK